MTACDASPGTDYGVTHLLPPFAQRRPPTTGYLRWWPLAAVAAANALVLIPAVSPVRAALLLPLLILLPGHLTLRLTGIRRPSGPDRLLHTVAFGVLWLIGISFVLGLLDALHPAGCLAAFDVTAAGLGVTAVLCGRPGGTPRVSSLVPAWRCVSKRAWTAIVLAAAAVALAATGAKRLNGGGSAILTESALAAGATALLFITAAAPANADSRSERTVLPAAAVLYLLGLAVLLATSLRGVGVTGHDIKPEFRVFQDTLARGGWHANPTLTDYNSCLSITTLPTLLHHLLGVAPLDVFRICFQMIFAAVPVGVLLIARSVLPGAPAILAAGLYVAFPTFVNDMPMLNRQELALLYFTVAVLTLLDRRGSRRQRTAVFAAMVAGLTVSHYSSTYVASGVILVAWLLLRASHWLRRLLRRIPTRTRPRRRLLGRVEDHLARVGRPRSVAAAPHLLTFRAVAIVLLCSVTWSFASGSGSGLVTTLSRTATSALSRGGTESDAVSYSFFRHAPPVSDQQALGEFISANGSRPSAAQQAALADACPIALEPDAVIPRTGVGDAMSAAGVPPATVNRWSRSLSVLLFELGALAGTVLLWLHSRRTVGPALIVTVLGAGTLAALSATVLLPELSVDYGLLRMFQQSLVVLAPAVIFALTGAVRLFGARAGAVTSAAVLAGCLVSTSGLLPQLTGDFPPQLNLNNSGAYYRAYYTSADDLTAARWVDAHLTAGTLLSVDSADFRTLRSMARLYPLEGMAPAMVPARAYLEVSQVGPDRAEAVAIARDRILTYTFPLHCVAAVRPLVYAVGTHRIYGPVS